MRPGEVDPEARAVIARRLCGLDGYEHDWPTNAGRVRDSYGMDADELLAALAAEGFSVVKLEQPKSDEMRPWLFADGKGFPHVMWTSAANPDDVEPLYRRVKGETT